MFEQTQLRIQPMEYRALMVTGLVESEVHENICDLLSADKAKLEARVWELEQELVVKEQRLETERGSLWDEAYEAGRTYQRSEESARIIEGSSRLAGAIEEFRTGRDNYLAQVEQEVVRLALAIAARILHRETQMDPLLLSGAVRVSLGQLAEKTEVRLRVPADEHEMWAGMLRLMPNLPLLPTLVLDDGMQAGECTIETHLGRIDLGIRAQLAEIERGFFDLLEHRGQVADMPEISRR